MRNIVFEAVKQFFESYTLKMIKSKDIDISENLLLKKEHSVRVSALCAQIAGTLEMDDEECELARIVGLLHDLGRFAQYEKYKSFDDSKTEDHASLGLSIIREQAFFSSLSEENQTIISLAIEQHNKFAINLNDKEAEVFAKILRDADKLDLWEICVMNMKRDGSFILPSIAYNLPNTPGISEVVLKNLLAGKPIYKNELHSLNDFKLFLFSMVFDLNYKPAFRLLSEKQLMGKLYDTLPKRDDVINAYRQVKLYIENKFIAK